MNSFSTLLLFIALSISCCSTTRSEEPVSDLLEFTKLLETSLYKQWISSKLEGQVFIYDYVDQADRLSSAQCRSACRAGQTAMKVFCDNTTILIKVVCVGVSHYAGSSLVSLCNGFCNSHFGGADVNTQDKRGITPLHSLVTNRYDVLALWLVRHGANIYLPDSNNYSAFDLAQGWFQKEMVAASEGKPVISEDLEEKNNPMYQILKTPAKENVIAQHAESNIPQSEVLKMYYRNDSYKSVKISSTETARDVCKRMSEKFNMSAYDKCFDVIEVVKNEVRYLNGGDYLLQSKSKWPIIVGATGNETHLHCHFALTLRKTAPAEAHDIFSRVA
eukprot:gene10559-12284_t